MAVEASMVSAIRRYASYWNAFFVTSDITVTSTLIRELMNKLDQLNSTVTKLEENNTALAEKVKVMEGTEIIFDWTS